MNLLLAGEAQTSQTASSKIATAPEFEVKGQEEHINEVGAQKEEPNK